MFFFALSVFVCLLFVDVFVFCFVDVSAGMQFSSAGG